MGFSDSKKSMWGEWISEEGGAYYKVYTYADGALRAKIRMGHAPEQISMKARFDGRRLTFEQFLDGGDTVNHTKCKTVLEHHPEDPERMICTLRPEDSQEPVTIELKRTGIITDRILD